MLSLLQTQYMPSVGIQVFTSISSFIRVEDWTQEFVQAKKALYQLSYIPSPEII